MASISRGQRVSTHRTEPVPSGSKMDPLQDTAEPVTDAGGTSVMTYFKKGEKRCLYSQPSCGGREGKSKRAGGLVGIWQPAEVKPP